MSDSEYREASRQQWGDAAAKWARKAEEEETGASADATVWMLGAADPQPGERVLELACGAGRVGLEVASRVEPAGTVLCSDFSEAMVEAVTQRIERREVSNASARVLNAEELDLPEEEPFDLVLCRFGYMLMADQQRALRESARVLRPGGRLVLAVWGGAEKNPWLSLILKAVMRHLGAPTPEPGTPGPFSLGDPERLRGLVDQAGLADVEVAEIETKQTYPSPAAWWEEILEVSGPLAAMLGALPEEDREKIRADVLTAADAFLAEDGKAVFPAAIVGAAARKPA
ncbi:MAG TPA: methyltransferase domain-containing protein [Solirubrobacterales bacterium]|jgi:SAM-dependent methyltransferase|nr:methyltransferase domain-containing protein [Solirubrobacterales bacterium]